MELIEFGRLSDAQYAELVGDEKDPWGAGADTLQWLPKESHVGLRDDNGRLLAVAGLVVVEVQFGGGDPVEVVGLGGVIVTASHRRRGLGRRVIAEALERAQTLGPAIVMLFCRPDRADMYRGHGFAEVPGPVLVGQPEGTIEIPVVTMWRALREGAELPPGRVKLDGLPF